MEPPSIRLAGAYPVDGDAGEPSTFFIPTEDPLFGGIGLQGLDPNVGPGADTSQTTCGDCGNSGAAEQVDPGSGGGPPARFCFEWFGCKWGRDYGTVFNWAKFAQTLQGCGQNPEQWACEHPVWSRCLDHEPDFEGCGQTQPPPPPPRVEMEINAGMVVGGPGAVLTAGRSLIAFTGAVASLKVWEAISLGFAPIQWREMSTDNVEDTFTVPELRTGGGGGGGGAVAWPPGELPGARFPFRHVVMAEAFDELGRAIYGVRATESTLDRVAQDNGTICANSLRHYVSPPTTLHPEITLAKKLGLSGACSGEGPLFKALFGGAQITARRKPFLYLTMVLELFSATGAPAAIKEFNWDFSDSTVGGASAVAFLGNSAQFLEGDSQTALLGPSLGQWRLRSSGVVVFVDGDTCPIPRKWSPVGGFNTSKYIFNGDPLHAWGCAWPNSYTMT